MARTCNTHPNTKNIALHLLAIDTMLKQKHKMVSWTTQ